MRRLLFLLAGLLLGAGAALGIGWGLLPPSTRGLTPADLRHDYRYEYVLLVAEDYAMEHDLARATARLQAVAPQEGKAILGEAMAYHLTHRTTEAQLRALAELARALNATTPAMEPYLEGP